MKISFHPRDMKNRNYEIIRIQKSFFSSIAPLALFVVILILAPDKGWSQTVNTQQEQSFTGKPTGSLTGKVVDSQHKPIAFVTVNIYHMPDSILLKGIATDTAGAYLFSQLEPGRYYLQGSFIGFKKSSRLPVSLLEGEQKKVPELVMIQAATQLTEVGVIAKRPFIERQVDKTVLNIESDVIASGGTALEALKRAPGITVDKDDNIQLRGKSGVMVMIDDKLTYMSTAQVTNMLKNMPATAVSQIEIITQPSARYDASGNTGIINIKTKKLKKLGLNGVVTAGAGYGHYAKYNGSINLNYQTGKFNFFTNYDFSRNKNYSTLRLTRQIRSKKDSTDFDQFGRFDNEYTNHNYKAGFDYSLTKNHTIGVQVSGYSNYGNTLSTSNSVISNPQIRPKVIDSILEASSLNPGTFRSIDYNLNYRGKIDTIGTSLGGDLDYSTFNNESHSTLTNTLFSSDKTQILKGPFIIQNRQPSDISIRVGKIDFSHPFNKTLKLETGIKYSAVTTNNTVAYDSIINNKPIPTKNQSNQFVYTEKLAAFYASLNKQFGKNTSIQLGLRIEHTASEGNSVTLNKNVKRSYTDFFPNVAISEKLGDNHQLGLSYTRRIDRPSYQDLNPFTFYIDQYTYQVGNPYLNPQYTDAFEISHTYKSSTILSVNYSHTRNTMIQNVLQDTATKSTHLTTSNINGSNSFGFTFSTPLVIAKWWTITPNLNINYNKYLASGSSVGGLLNAGKVAFNLNAMSSMTLANDFTIEFSGNYNSSAIYGYLHADPQYSISGGLQKTLFNKKATLKLNVNDIFYTEKFSGRQPNINLTVLNKWESRRASLTFTYRFGGSGSNNHKDTGSAEEKNRVKSGH